jgi:hypothetical protein
LYLTKVLLQLRHLCSLHYILHFYVMRHLLIWLSILYRKELRLILEVLTLFLVHIVSIVRLSNVLLWCKRQTCVIQHHSTKWRCLDTWVDWIALRFSYLITWIWSKSLYVILLFLTLIVQVPLMEYLRAAFLILNFQLIELIIQLLNRQISARMFIWFGRLLDWMILWFYFGRLCIIGSRMINLRLFVHWNDILSN